MSNFLIIFNSNPVLINRLGEIYRRSYPNALFKSETTGKVKQSDVVTSEQVTASGMGHERL